MFKLDIDIDVEDQHRLEMFYSMLDEMPELEVCRIKVDRGDNEFINTLAQKSMFKTKQELFKILDYDNLNSPKQPEPHEYLSKVLHLEDQDMSWFVKQAKWIQIRELEKDVNIDWEVDHVHIYLNCIENIQNFNLGTQKFFDSVNTITIDYSHGHEKPDYEIEQEVVHKYFKNLKHWNLENVQNISVARFIKILKNWKINHVSLTGK